MKIFRQMEQYPGKGEKKKRIPRKVLPFPLLRKHSTPMYRSISILLGNSENSSQLQVDNNR